MLRSDLKSITAYSLEQPPHRIKLNQNESPFDIPEHLKRRVLAKMARLSWNRYPTPYADRLREAIAKKEGWDPEGIVVSGGSNLLVQLLVLATSLESRVMTVTPSFSLYEIEARLHRNRVVSVPLNPIDFSLPTARFLTTMKKTRPTIVFLANPNAPTGNLFSQEDLLKILQQANCLVVVDEAYYPFSGETLRPYLKRFPRLVILRTLSKASSLAGVRIGYLMASRRIAQGVKKVMLPFTVGILQEAIGMTLLENDGYVQEVVKKTQQEKNRLYREMKRIPGVTPCPSSANYLLFKVKNGSEVYRSLVKRGILVRPMSGHHLKNCLRVSVGTPAENNQFLKALRQLS